MLQSEQDEDQLKSFRRKAQLNSAQIKAKGFLLVQDAKNVYM